MVSENYDGSLVMVEEWNKDNIDVSLHTPSYHLMYTSACFLPFSIYMYDKINVSFICCKYNQHIQVLGTFIIFYTQEGQKASQEQPKRQH